MDRSFTGAIDLDSCGTVPLYRQIYEQLREAILTGTLKPGTKVPPSRVMAQELGLSRTTIINAVDQLVAEGYLGARQGSGTFVTGWQRELEGRKPESATRSSPPARHSFVSKQWKLRLAQGKATERPSKPRPLRPGIPDLDEFPAILWARLMRRASLAQSADAAGYGFLSGHPDLRTALAGHLTEYRLVDTSPGDIIVTSSAQAALDLISRLLIEPDDPVWIEDPGYRGARSAFLNAGAKLIPIPVDGDGMAPDRAPSPPTPKLIYVTPSHQYPLGHTLSLARRLEILELAEAANAIIIEDDYDSEFHYEGRPIAALQGLRKSSNVIYVGTFSKALLPGLRLGYMAVPPALTSAIKALQRSTGHYASAGLQIAAAEFINAGHYRSHVRRMQSLYHKRRDTLISAIDSELPGLLTPLRPQGGMQLAGFLPKRRDDTALAEMLIKEGVEVDPLSSFFIGRPKQRGFLMGYAAWPEDQIEHAIKTMRVVLERSSS
ncbi:HTH-type transcriptional regulatory protein GabR [bacterium MnTg02]|nr:HTH-type transcriptional regulatory protein GabR [bacterium MnTg02]